MVASYNPSYSSRRGSGGASIEPLMFAPGVAITLVGGVLLLKAVKEYLK